MADKTADIDSNDTDDDPEVEVDENAADDASDDGAQDDSSKDGDDKADKDDAWDPERAKETWARKNRENKSLRTENKRLREIEDKFKEAERAKLSKEERLAAELADRDGETVSVRTELNQLKVQKKFPEIDDDLLDFVGTGSLEDMMGRAEKLAAKLAKDAKDDGEPTPKTGSRKPSARKLSGGSDPDGDDGERDIFKLAAAVPRGF